MRWLAEVSPLRRQDGRAIHAGQCAAAGDGVFRRHARTRAVPSQRVAFGTSGHRGSAFDNAFNEAHILAISQAICRSPKPERHHRTAVHRHRHPCAVRARPGQRARGICRQWRRRDDRRARRVHADAGHFARDPDLQQEPQAAVSPTASSSRPSHNPPEDGGFKYNPPNGGPADTDVTGWIERSANALLETELEAFGGFRSSARANQPRVHRYDYIGRLCRRPRERRRHGGDPRVRRERSASIRWAAPASIIGNRSSNAMASRRRSSATRSTRPFAS